MHQFCEPKLRIPAYWLGRVLYADIWAQMKKQTQLASGSGADELVWLCEHEPVYTTGRRGIDNRRDCTLPAELVRTDRGGETTFHGPGQLMLYPVVHLRRRRIGVKQYVRLLEQSCIDLLAGQHIEAGYRHGFPGVWTSQGKIAALGVRVSRGVAYHGMALNVDVEQRWFAAIQPCGLQSSVVSMSDFINPQPLAALAECWQSYFFAALAECSSNQA